MDGEINIGFLMQAAVGTGPLLSHKAFGQIRKMSSARPLEAVSGLARRWSPSYEFEKSLSCLEGESPTPGAQFSKQNKEFVSLFPT